MPPLTPPHECFSPDDPYHGYRKECKSGPCAVPFHNFPYISPRRLPHRLYLFRRRKAPRSGTDRYNETVQNEVKSPYGSRPAGTCPVLPIRIPALPRGTLHPGTLLPFSTEQCFPCCPHHFSPENLPYPHGSRHSPCRSRTA